jgi:dolichol kinase
MPTDLETRSEPVPAGRASLLRKLVHMAMVIVPAAGWLVSYRLALILAGVILLASLGVEVARRWWPWINNLLWKVLPTIFRAWEDRRVLGSTWYALGLMATLLTFGRDVGGTAVLFLMWGDPMAELVGRRWGRPGGGKTLAGSAGCLAACLLAGLIGVGLGGLSPWTVLAGATAATLVERWSPPPDDNLWMPILSGLVMAVIQGFIGGWENIVLFSLWG